MTALLSSISFSTSVVNVVIEATSMRRYFRIDPCTQAADSRSKPTWMVSLTRGPDDLDSVTYGVVPGRYEQTGIAPQLTPGCYQATVGGSPGRVRFDVAADGSVHERPEGS
jgi:hypothetical protein